MRRSPLPPRKKPLKRTGAPKRKTGLKKVNTARLAKRQKAYDAYMRSGRWQSIRAEVIVRDGKCVRCGSRGTDALEGSFWYAVNEIMPIASRFEVHHKTYARFGKERLEDLETLCRTCHEKEHASRFITPRGLRQ